MASGSRLLAAWRCSVIWLMNHCYCKDKLALYVAMQHHSSVSSISSKEIDFGPLPERAFFLPQRAGSVKLSISQRLGSGKCLQLNSNSSWCS
jgi:hypothetical protein